MFIHTLRIVAVPFYEVRFPDFFIGDQVDLIRLNNTRWRLITRHWLISFIWCSICVLVWILFDSHFHRFISSICRLLLSFEYIDTTIPPILAKSNTNIHSICTMFTTICRYTVGIHYKPDVSDYHPHLYNGIKYLLSITAMCFMWNTPSYVILMIVYTCYALNWDLREDWGT